MTKLNRLFCAVMAALGVLASYPVLESGICDDFSYAKTSLDLAKTGHLVYNGWATAMLGWQAYWGALIIKLFGFSFLALRLSTLPFAMGSAVLLVSISQRAGLNKSNSVLCALTVVLSPVYIPLAASFMTDVPALFWTLVCLYCCVRAVKVGSFRGAVAWLILCTFASLMGGTGRQTVWLGALVMVPSAAWLLRSQKSIPKIAAALWIFSFAFVLLCIAWFEHQPYSVPENLAGDRLSAGMIVTLGRHIATFAFTTLLFSLPALAVYLPNLWREGKKHFLPLLVILAAILCVGLGPGLKLCAPWMLGMVTPTGVDGGDFDLLGFSAIVLTRPVRVILTMFMAAVLYAFMSFAIRRTRPDSLGTGEGGSLPWRSLLWLVVPFTLAYLALLTPRAASQGVFGVTIFDRYTIPLIPVVVIIALRLYQEQIRPSVPIPAVLTLAVFSGYAVAAMHDYFATQRAVVDAASSLIASGIPRRDIQASFEYDGWTELETTGHLNDVRILVPKGAYHKTHSRVPIACWFEFADHTPSVDPKYLVASSSLRCLVPAGFPSVSIRTWLPPFDRQILIRNFSTQIDSR